MSGCYKDDIDGLKAEQERQRIEQERLRAEQERLAELLGLYKDLLDALNNNLLIVDVTPIANGVKIVFSNGSETVITNGTDGTVPLITIGANGNWFIDDEDTGEKAVGKTPEIKIIDGYWHINGENTGVKAATENDAPQIIGVADVGETIKLFMSDGSTITIGKVPTVGLWVLSEGGFGAGNGQLIYYDYNAVTDRFVRNDAKRFQNWGETPNDLMIYGDLMYSAITGTAGNGVVRVVNVSTGATIRDIVITKDDANQQPRRLAASGGNVFVTLYSGAVAKICTTAFTYQVAGLSGTFSEGIAVHGQYLYIANSGQGEGNTISVVCIANFVETETITVPHNPVNIVSVGNGELYINTASVWSGPAAGAPANIHVLNTATKEVTKTFDIAADNIVAGRNYVYGTGFDWGEWESTFVKISIADKSVSNINSSLIMPYKLSVNPLTGEVFQTEQMAPRVNRFSEDGTFIEQLNVGADNGAAVVFVNAVK